MMRRAKIVATIGPASSAPDVIEHLIAAGVDVARLNFSHGRHEEHAEVIGHVRAASRRLRRPVAILQDLQGPKIRTGRLKAGKAGVALRRGTEIVITTGCEVVGDDALVSTTYRHLARDVRPGDRLLVDDGLLELRVISTDGVRARCEVLEGGVLGEHKGINLPGVALRTEALSEKDRTDLAFGHAHDVDYVALSFVRSPEDVHACRAEMERLGRVVPIVAKIEKPEAIEHLDAIVEAADAVMVARGDLGVEIRPERVPSLQKDIVRRCNAAGRPVIIATQMLNSMIEHSRPTRAEASDVANSIWDGASAVMLSGETASGQHPVAAVEMMDRIVRSSEEDAGPCAPARGAPGQRAGHGPAPRVVAVAAVRAAQEAGAVAICCFTVGGTTARLLAHCRPHVPVIAFSPDQAIRRRLALYWGVVPKVMEPTQDPEAMAAEVGARLVAERHAQPGDVVVLVYGSPLGVPGRTNSIRVHAIPAGPAGAAAA